MDVRSRASPIAATPGGSSPSGCCRLADEDPVVVGLPRGGVPVAEEVATALGAPLEILAVRKLGAPHNPEYGIGAIAEDGTRVFDPEALAVLGIDNRALESIVARETAELRRRVAAYRGDRPPMPLTAAR